MMKFVLERGLNNIMYPLYQGYYPFHKQQTLDFQSERVCGR